MSSQPHWKTPLLWTLAGGAVSTALAVFIFGGADARWIPTLITLAILFAIPEFTKDAYKRRVAQVITVGACLCAFGALAYWDSQTLSLYYNGRKLNGQHIVISKSCNAPHFQSMCIDPNMPQNFDMFGMGMFPKRAVEGEIILLHFSEKVTGVSSQWRSDDPGSQYSFPLERQILPTGLLVSVPAFYGTPIPQHPITVTITVYYADKMTSATFTLIPPD